MVFVKAVHTLIYVIKYYQGLINRISVVVHLLNHIHSHTKAHSVNNNKKLWKKELVIAYQIRIS